MKKRKMNHDVRPNGTESYLVGTFWSTHYSTNQQIDTIDIHKVHQHYISSNPDQSKSNIERFIQLSKGLGIKTRKDRNKNHKVFFAKPTSDEAKQYHT